MSYFRKILIIIVAVSFFILVFSTLNSSHLPPSNIYAGSADSAISGSIRLGKTAEDITFMDIFKKNPYCLVDPTCVSFITNDGMALWQHEFRGAVGLGKFAVPNAILFLLFLAVILYGLLQLAKENMTARRILIGIILMFTSLEIIRWFSEISPYESNEARLLLSYLGTTMIGLSIVYFTVRATRRD